MKAIVGQAGEDGGVVVHVSVVRRGSLGASRPHGANVRPVLVRYEGREFWVYEDEGDARKLPGDVAPARPW